MRNNSFFAFFFLATTLLFTSACNSDDEEIVTTPEGTFKVTVTNVMEAKDYPASGTTGFLAPGENLQFSFNAGKGHHLSLATMLVQTNDLFYAPAAGGIALYDDNGVALTGDITASFDLWDAGTEVNQEPGVGADQPPRQSGPNVGADENGTVQLISAINDGYTYPADEDILKVELAHDGGTEFTVTIENISSTSSLPSPLAPGVYVIHGEGTPLFTVDAAATAGIEALSEDGDNSISETALVATTGYVSPFAPGVWAIHDSGIKPLFTDGVAEAGQGLEGLAEDGDPAPLNTAIAALNGVSQNGVFNTPNGATAPGPIFPGQSYEFTFTAEDGDYLSLATMLIQTNDLFYGFEDAGIALFENGTAISGDVTAKLLLWDSGTEVNEYPGAGNNQPVRGGGNSGAAENGVVQVVNDGFTYPANGEVIQITIEAN